MQNLCGTADRYVLYTNTHRCWSLRSCRHPKWNLFCAFPILTLYGLEISSVHNPHDVSYLQHRSVCNGVGVCTRNVISQLILRVQNGTNICPDLKNCAKFALNIAFFVYYFAASILTFFIYREFKAVAFEKNP